MKRKNTLLLMLGVLALALVALVLVSRMEPKAAPAEENASLKLGCENLTAFTVGDMPFVKRSEGWAYEKDDAFPADQDKLTAMAQVLESLTADKVIEAPADDKSYGLDDPLCTVSFDGKTLRIGSDAAMDAGRYFSLGDGKIYIAYTDILTPFQYALLDLVRLDTAPMMENLTQVTLERKGQEPLVLRDRQAENLSYSEDYIWFCGDTPLDTEDTEDLIRRGTDMVWSGCADYNAPDLSAYGLEDPTLRLTVSYAKGTYTLEVGDAVSGKYYARMNDSRVIYWMDAADVNTLLEADPNDLYPKEVLLMAWDTVTSVTARYAGETWTFVSAQRDKESTEAGETVEEGEQETYWLLNGTEVPLGDLLTALTDMTPTASAMELTPERAEDLHLTVSRQGKTDVSLSFYRYTGTESLVTLNGTPTVLVSRQDVVNLMEGITKIVLG